MTDGQVEPPRIAASQLVDAIAREFELRLDSLELTQGGWDGAAQTWLGVDAEGSRWAVKTTTRDVGFGLAVAASLAEAGGAAVTGGVAVPRRTVGGTPWAQLDDAIVAVTPWIDGVDGPDAVIDWAAFGRLLRTVHEHPPPSSAPARRGIRRHGRSAAALIREIDELVDSVPAGSAERETLREMWPTVRGRLAALAEAERALKRSRGAATRVTLHGDPHLGNVVVDPSGRPWLIDFDEATVAPREADLMLIELGVLFSRPISESERRAFRAGYGTDAVIDEARIARFGCVRAVEDVTSTYRAVFAGNLAVDIDRVSFVDGMLGPHGLVTLVEADLRRLEVSRRRGAEERPA